MISFDVGVILPAAGTGERIGTKPAKQYVPILGKPLFLYALEQVLRPPWVRCVVLVVDAPATVQMMLRESRIRGTDRVIVVAGAHSRHRSIRYGLQALQRTEMSLRVVVVHDAVRPIVPLDLMERLVELADLNGAAGAVRPLTSTVLRASSVADANATLVLETSLDRNAYCASETPQAFQMGVLATAYDKSTDEELDSGTECLALVLEHTNVRPRLVEGPPDLWKVTHKKDLHTAIGYLRERSMRVCLVADPDHKGARILTQKLFHHVLELFHISPERSHGSRVYGNVQETPTYSAVVFFHVHKIPLDSGVSAMLDAETQGVIIHVIEHLGCRREVEDVSALELHRIGCRMAFNHKKVNKAVIIVHWLSLGEEHALTDLIKSLILSDNPHAFSGQTLFV